jgi:hypothetical protein
MLFKVTVDPAPKAPITPLAELFIAPCCKTNPPVEVASKTPALVSEYQWFTREPTVKSTQLMRR